MTEPLSTAQLVLREAGFTTRPATLSTLRALTFEDEVVTGFACSFGSPESLLAGWKAAEASLLSHYASDLNLAGDKAWNIYSVFLCGAPSTSIQARQIRWIEEDLERTRKVAACGLVSREDISRALLPLLPLQYSPILGSSDVTERLRSRLRSIAPGAWEVVLNEQIPAIEVARLLSEAP